MCRKLLALCLIFGLSSAQFSLYAAPSPSSPSVTLSLSEYEAVMAALEQAKIALQRSNQEIQKLSENSTMLWILSGALGVVALVEGVVLALKN